MIAVLTTTIALDFVDASHARLVLLSPLYTERMRSAGRLVTRQLIR